MDQARRLAASRNGAIAEGRNPAVKLRAGRNAPTLGELFNQFIALPTRTEAKRPKSPVTVTGYRQQFGYLEDWNGRKLSTITKNDVETIHNHIATDSGRYMANRVLGLVKTLFNTAIEPGAIQRQPRGRRPRFVEESRERFLQADELPRFFKALEEETSEKVRDFIKLALFTGQRRMNCLQMRWEDVHLDRAVWSLPKTKTGRHQVPLTAAALEVLRRRHDQRTDSEFVFPGLHGRDHLKDPMRQWRGILKRAGIENLRLHDLRRSLGSWQATTGASLSVIGKVMGHAQPNTTAIYARLADAPVATRWKPPPRRFLQQPRPSPR